MRRGAKPRPRSKTEQLLRLASKPLRARDLDAAGIPRAYLQRLLDRGLLERVDRGLYRRVDAEASELHTLAEVAARVPRGTVCTLSALRVHNLTTQNPSAVWLLIETHTRPPKLSYPPLEISRASGEALTHGVEERVIDGVDVRITTPAKTVADCFRYRGKVGTDVAVEALQAFMQKARARNTDRKDYNVDALLAAARVDRVERVMRPYLEALS